MEVLFQLRQEYRNQLSLHSHHQLAEAFGINRIHFTEKNEMKHPKLFEGLERTRI
jgi:thiamine-phosphate pyrophosphorylase